MTIIKRTDFSTNLRIAAAALIQHRVPSNMALMTDSIRAWQLPRTNAAGPSTSIGMMNGLTRHDIERVHEEIEAARVNLIEHGDCRAALQHVRAAQLIVDLNGKARPCGVA